MTLRRIAAAVIVIAGFLVALSLAAGFAVDWLVFSLRLPRCLLDDLRCKSGSLSRRIRGLRHYPVAERDLARLRASARIPAAIACNLK